MGWPFTPIHRRNGELTNFVALHGPLRRPDEIETYARLRQRFRFLGFTSCGVFPRSERTVPGEGWLEACEAWCHCFRDPSEYLPPGRPAALISYSDFVDLRPPETMGRKIYDVVCVCPSSPWGDYTKNWALARRCLVVLSEEFGLRTVVVGRQEGEYFPGHGGAVEVLPELDHARLIEVVCRSRCLLVASVVDASPRLICESLCLNVPIVVNRAILGGWKYVNRHTGCFFEDEGTVGRAVVKAIQECTEPRRWYRANYGPYVSGRRLARFLREVDRSVVEPCVYPGAFREAQTEGA